MLQLVSNGNKMVLVFFIIQIYNFIKIHMKYDNISFYLYVGYFLATCLIPLVWMVVARILLGFIIILQSNQQLIKTIQRILQVFPEGIIIQSLDEKSQQVVLQFVNNTANREIINYDYSWEKPIEDSKLDYMIAMVDNVWQNNINEYQDIQFYKLSEYLQSQIDEVCRTHTEVTSSIELKDINNTDDISIQK